MNFDTLATNSLRQACLDLVPEPRLEDHGETQEYCIAAIAGFSGDQVNGALGISATEAGLRRVSTSLGAEDCPSGAEDSLGELANHLLGHIQRTFASHGVMITLATPLVVRGRAIAICGRSQGRWFEEVSELGHDRLTVWLDACVDDRIEISAEAIKCRVARQGDAFLF